MATRKVRIKKLNPKQPLDILTQDEFDASEYESMVQELSIATGVEQGEENVRTTSRASHVMPPSPGWVNCAYLHLPWVHASCKAATSTALSGSLV